MFPWNGSPGSQSASSGNGSGPSATFGNATLNTLVDSVLAYYPGSTLNEQNVADKGFLRPLGTGVSTIDGKTRIAESAGVKKLFAAIPGDFRQYTTWVPYTISFKIDPARLTTSPSGDFLQACSGSAPFGLVVNFSNTNLLRIHTGITGYVGFADTGGSLFVGPGTEEQVSFICRLEAGVPTLILRVGGVTKFTWAGLTVIGDINGLVFTHPGDYRDIYFFNTGLTDAQETLLASHNYTPTN